LAPRVGYRSHLMKNRTIKIAAAVFVFAVSSVFAKETKFVNHGLSTDTNVVLDVAGKTVKGTYSSNANNSDETHGPAAFTGKVIPTPKGKKGIYLRIEFAGPAPYDTKDLLPLTWHLKIVGGRAHLFIPMHQRNYTTVPAKWVIDDVELEPVDDE
jgi:hypothetical protein